MILQVCIFLQGSIKVYIRYDKNTAEYCWKFNLMWKNFAKWLRLDKDIAKNKGVFLPTTYLLLSLATIATRNSHVAELQTFPLALPFLPALIQLRSVSVVLPFPDWQSQSQFAHNSLKNGQHCQHIYTNTWHSTHKQ